MACLQGDSSPAVALEVPLRFTLPEVATEPTVATMYASHATQDENSLGSHSWRQLLPPLEGWPLGNPTGHTKAPTNYRGYHRPPHGGKQ